MTSNKNNSKSTEEVSRFGAYLEQQENKSFLRILTCGSVDDGKSTLIGRLLYDTKLIYNDQLQRLESDSKTYGTTGDEIDFALLVDGLEAEREQGITIDVAYRYFATEKRKFIVADTPGHIQYTKNMVTGASTAKLAILMIDARKGLLEQTKRHAFICSLLGISNIIVAINKVDLVEYSQEIYTKIKTEFLNFSQNLAFKTMEIIPISARYSENIVKRSTKMDWYKGPFLLEHLDNVEADFDLESNDFRMPIQWVNRPHLDFRGFCGTVASGVVKRGQEICILPSNKLATIKNILVTNSSINGSISLEKAIAGDAVTIELDAEVDVSRGDMFSLVKRPAKVADQFVANVIWMSDKPLYAGRSYLLKINSKTVACSFTRIRYRIDIEKFNEVSTKVLHLNEIAVCEIATNDAVVFDNYDDISPTGAFIIIDRMTNETVGVGMVKDSMQRAGNVKLEKLEIDKAAHSTQKGQKSVILWFTGLSGSGKSTISNLVAQKLHVLNHHAYLLDGDNIRLGLNRDLGFADADRVENIRRIGEVAKLMVDAGLITIVSFISPFISERQQARSIVEDDEFVEIYVSTSLETCIERDVKGLYKRAMAGEITNFTGISSPYEPPQNPELNLSTVENTPDQASDKVIMYLKQRNIIT